MNAVTGGGGRSVAAEVKAQVQASEGEFAAALPPHIPVERFMRVVQTAIVSNPTLMNANRKSLFEAAMKAAQDGLLPDGRDGAFVTFKDKVQWMPMVGGILKKVRNSGELLTIGAHVVHENDRFSYRLGDEEMIDHEPLLTGDRGDPVIVYAIAKTKDGGIYREVMTVREIEQVRSVSRAKDAGPWKDWWTEMARKTVIRRLAKRLPMSTDLDDLIRRDDALYDFEGQRQVAPAVPLRERLAAARAEQALPAPAEGFDPRFIAGELAGPPAEGDDDKVPSEPVEEPAADGVAVKESMTPAEPEVEAPEAGPEEPEPLEPEVIPPPDPKALLAEYKAELAACETAKEIEDLNIGWRPKVEAAGITKEARLARAKREQQLAEAKR